MCSPVILLLGFAPGIAFPARRTVFALRGGRAAARMVATEPTPQSALAPPLTAGVESLSFEEIATIPKPGSLGLSMIAFSPDDRYVTYLGSADATSLGRELYVFDREAPAEPAKLVIAPSEGGGEENAPNRHVEGHGYQHVAAADEEDAPRL